MHVPNFGDSNLSNNQESARTLTSRRSRADRRSLYLVLCVLSSIQQLLSAQSLREFIDSVLQYIIPVSREMSSNIMNRQLIEKEDGVQIPALPLLAIRGHLCFRCLSRPAKLTKCGACKRAVYCGKNCQMLDWKIQHKKDCKILQTINEREEQEKVTSRSRELWIKPLLCIGELLLLRRPPHSRSDISIPALAPFFYTPFAMIHMISYP